jgi:hypothetical protein
LRFHPLSKKDSTFRVGEETKVVAAELRRDRTATV